jgi:hypothetical protein
MTTQEFIFDAPLFCKIEGEEAQQIWRELTDVLRPKFDGFNAQRSMESTYTQIYEAECRHNARYRNHPTISCHQAFDYTEPWYVTFRCGRYGDEIELMLLLNAKDKSIMKVGQYPTIADMHKAQIKQYKSVLSNDEMKEFTRAIGLAASGVGIGSFVYLRRIFENLIEEAYKQALSNGDVEEDVFMRMRMDEKIGVLKDYLPKTLVEIKQIYGILSKGIHELSEKECLSYFNAMRMGIEIILDDKLEQRKREEKRARAIAQVSTISGELKK